MMIMATQLRVWINLLATRTPVLARRMRAVLMMMAATRTKIFSSTAL
jgi:hypothetical protein